MDCFTFISEIEMFKDLNKEEIEILITLLSPQNIHKNSLLFEEKDPRDALYLIQEGRIEISRKYKFRGDRRIVIFEEGDFFSEAALFDESPHSTNAKALSDCKLHLLTRKNFDILSKDHSKTAFKILTRATKIITRRMNQISTLYTQEFTPLISGKTRLEHDLLGQREVPYEAYYGIQSLRAIENFRISGVPLSHYPLLIEGIVMVKMAAAKANADIDILPKDISDAIHQAGYEILQGKLLDQFVLDMIQGGAGTSTNMLANEVIANRALEILGHKKGQYTFCHPNNHVNLSQSTNDAYPCSLKISMYKANQNLVKELKELILSFDKKAEEFKDFIKMARTQLQDAVPTTLGLSFEAYSVSLKEDISCLNQNADLFLKLNLGGTAIGTGLNAKENFGFIAVDYLKKISGIDFSLAHNLMENTQSTSAFVMYSSALKQLSVKLSKICNDLRLLSSGPRAGLNEIHLPEMQPGSSIMPGKVNPVIPEVVNQIAFKVIGNDLAVTLASEAGQLELNVMEPIMATCIFESIEMLNNGIRTLKYRCLDGIKGNKERCLEYVHQSIGIVTALNPLLGYETCSELAKEALHKKANIYDLVLEKSLLSKEELDKLLDPQNMIRSTHKK